MTKYFVDPSDENTGHYEIQVSDEGWRYAWSEVALGVEYNDFGAWHPTRWQALDDAADDWEDNGDGTLNARLTATLRGLATRERNRTSVNDVPKETR